MSSCFVEGVEMEAVTIIRIVDSSPDGPEEIPHTYIHFCLPHPTDTGRGDPSTTILFTSCMYMATYSREL